MLQVRCRVCSAIFQIEESVFPGEVVTEKGVCPLRSDERKHFLKHENGEIEVMSRCQLVYKLWSDAVTRFPHAKISLVEYYHLLGSL